MIRRPPRSTQSRSSAASDVYKREATKSIKRTRANAAPKERTWAWRTSRAISSHSTGIPVSTRISSCAAAKSSQLLRSSVEKSPGRRTKRTPSEETMLLNKEEPSLPADDPLRSPTTSSGEAPAITSAGENTLLTPGSSSICLEIRDISSNCPIPAPGSSANSPTRGVAPPNSSSMRAKSCLMGSSSLKKKSVSVSTDQLFFFKDDDPIRQDFARMEELFGGATPLVGEFVLDPGAGFGQLQEISRVSREMEELPGVQRVFSPADVIAGVSPEEVVGLLSGSSAGSEGSSLLSSMVSSDGVRFVLLPGDFSTEDLRSWLDFAAAHEEIRVLTGMPVLWDEMARLVLQAQVRSLGAAFALVLLMLFVAYRRVRQTVVSLLPLSLTIIMLLGFLAASGIQLNLITAIASSIVLGVGIDYAIHLVAAIDWARREGDGYVLRAIDKAGRPIVANALGNAVGLTALWFSAFKFRGHISLIIWVSMTTARPGALATMGRPALSMARKT